MTKINDQNNRFSKPVDQFVQNTGSNEKLQKRRFPKQLLHDIRNRIPVRYVITTELRIPNQMDSGVFRFECPRCRSFHSSVKEDTNLSRCFDCRISWNTIELVMEVRKIGFRESVEILIPVLENFSPARSLSQPTSGKLADIGSIINSMPALKIINDSPGSKQVAQRLQNLENEVGAIKNRMEQFYKFLVREVSK